jgi:hypothetical protein
MEIYRNQSTVVPIKLPTGAVFFSVKAYRAGEEISPAPTATYASGTVSVTLPWPQYQLDGDIRIVCYFDIGTTPGASIEEYVSVVTPLIRADQLTDTSDYAQIEPIVRHVISSYTGQSFGKWIGAYNVEANSGVLYLPDRVLSLSDVVSRGVTYDDSLFDIHGDGWFLGYKDLSGMDIGEAITYPQFDSLGVIYAPPIRWANKGFVDNQFYLVSGTFGYDYVPHKVVQAAKILYSDYACADAAYRDRYLSSIRSADWRLEFNSGAWRGTGNVKADLLLDEYRRSGMVII